MSKIQRPNRIWAIGGGKGGIGKSFISSTFAICLARMAKEVTLVDLDLGSANLHTYLGMKEPKLSLSDFISGRVDDLNQVSTATEFQNMRFISGFNDALNIADLGVQHKTRLIQALRTIRTPYVILDLGAGTTENTLDFFLSADEKLIAVTPEPTSIENAYRFIKSSYYRKLRTAEVQLGMQDVFENAMDARNQLGIRSPADLLRYVTERDPAAGADLSNLISELHLHIILNQVRTRADVELGHSIKSVCQKYFGIECDYLGYIDHDNAVWQALRKRRPLVLEHPYSSIVGQFLNMTKNLLNPHSVRAVV
ncbi:MAG: P-loop NTPase [Bdellovibrionaceae bacterium]|nr:P-loop NTPase [Pseudobdellovibrionaceae bacterium]